MAPSAPLIAPAGGAPRRGARHRCLLGVVLVGLVVAFRSPAAAGHLSDFTQEEFRTLPRVCLAQRFINEELETEIVPEAERKQVSERMGSSFLHYHHYCWALMLMRRAGAPGGDKYDYTRVVDNLNYVIERADPSCPLLPDVYVQKGTALERLGDRDAAVGEYRNALRVQAAYTPARAALVQVYLDRGQIAAAQAALAEGLKHDPGSKTLAAKKAALDARAAVAP